MHFDQIRHFQNLFLSRVTHTYTFTSIYRTYSVLLHMTFHLSFFILDKKAYLVMCCSPTTISCIVVKLRKKATWHNECNVYDSTSLCCLSRSFFQMAAGRWERRFARLSGGPPEWQESLSILQFTNRPASLIQRPRSQILPTCKKAAVLFQTAAFSQEFRTTPIASIETGNSGSFPLF